MPHNPTYHGNVALMGIRRRALIEAKRYQTQTATPADLADLKARALADPYVLGTEVLGYDKMIPRLHGEWSTRLCGKIDPLNLGGYRGLVLAFRGSYKSSFFTVTLPLWLLARNPNLRILIVNESFSNAELFVGEQQSHIRHNDLFRALFGDWEIRGEFRDRDYVISTRTSIVGKESSVTAAGLDSRLVSAHYDVIIVDDLVGPGDRDSQPKRDATLKFYRDVFSLLEPHGALIVIGTRWHPEDLYDHIVHKQNPELIAAGQNPFELYFHPAVLDDGETPAYPEILSAEEMTKLRIEKGVVEFSAQYLLDPMIEEDRIFKHLHFFDPNTITMNGQPIYGYSDFSAGKSQEKGDYSAIITAIKDKDGSVLIWDADVKRRPVSDTNAKIIFKEQAQHHYTEFGVEDDTYSLISEDLNRQSKEKGAYLIIRKRPTSGLPQKTGRINKIEGLVSSGIIKFRSDWKTAPNNYYLLIEQLQQFGLKSAHDDAPDALEGLVWLIRGDGGKYTFWTLKEKKDDTADD